MNPSPGSTCTLPDEASQAGPAMCVQSSLFCSVPVAMSCDQFRDVKQEITMDCGVNTQIVTNRVFHLVDYVCSWFRAKMFYIACALVVETNECLEIG